MFRPFIQAIIRLCVHRINCYCELANVDTYMYTFYKKYTSLMIAGRKHVAVFNKMKVLCWMVSIVIAHWVHA